MVKCIWKNLDYIHLNNVFTVEFLRGFKILICIMNPKGKQQHLPNFLTIGPLFSLLEHSLTYPELCSENIVWETLRSILRPSDSVCISITYYGVWHTVGALCVNYFCYFQLRFFFGTPDSHI